MAEKPSLSRSRQRRNRRGKSSTSTSPKEGPSGKKRQDSVPGQAPKKEGQKRRRSGRPASGEGKQRPQGKSEKAIPRTASLTGRILALVQREPLDHASIANKLQLGGKEREELKNTLSQMEKEGRVARIRRDRYVIPKEADLFTGEIQFHASGAAHVLAAKKGEPDVYISAENTATAMHGDKVVARISPPRPGGGRERDESRKEGRVIRILERGNDRIVGTLQKSKNFFYVVADDPRFVHNLYVPEPTSPVSAKVGDIVVAQLEAWVSRHVNPEGKVIEVLGRAGEPGVDMLAIVRKYRLPEEFPPEVVSEGSRVSQSNPSDEAGNREDRRNDEVLTIDPDDARDFDDAIHVETISKGWSISVHIADVSHYVQPGSLLDQEAYIRGNSVYLPDRVIPMLPESLSNGLCSLRPDEDRLAFSVFAEVSPDGHVKKTRFAKTVIRSHKRLTYRDALAALQKKPANKVEEHLHRAWEVASLLRKRRFENGSLDLDFPETKVWLDDQGKPIRIEKMENDISHQLVEEMMLLANEAVAKEMRLHKQPVVYRVHEQPDELRLREYREMVLSHGLKCGDLSNRDELQRLLADVRGEPSELAVKIGLLKSLQRARYSEVPLGHYGLAKTDYLHFTSPIRRYADLIVHRALERHLGITKKGPDSTKLPSMAEHISTTERIATDAERESVKMKKLEFFQLQIADRKGEAFAARVIEVRNYGLFIELPEFLISGLIHVSALEGDFYVFDPVRSRFHGRRTKKSYAVGDELNVLVSRVDLFKQQIDFQPAPTGKK